MSRPGGNPAPKHNQYAKKAGGETLRIELTYSQEETALIQQRYETMLHRSLSLDYTREHAREIAKRAILKEIDPYEVGYQAATEMLDRGAYPTSRNLDSFDIHLYAEVAASCYEISDLQRGDWMREFENGYLDRLQRCIVLPNGTVIQKWRRNDTLFGVAGASARFRRSFEDLVSLDKVIGREIALLT